MRARFAMAAALGAAWLLAFPATAQEARKYDTADTVTVVAVDPQQQRITVRDEEGGERIFAVDEKTRIERGGQDIALGEVASQSRVVVNARSEPLGEDAKELVADTIVVVVADTDLATEPAGSEPLQPLPAGDGPTP